MTPSPRIYALIVAAGSGHRAGGALPKQYQWLGGVPMLRHSAERFAHHPHIMGVQVVIQPEHHALYAQATVGLSLLPPVFGGSLRTDSVRAGLNALALFHPDYVLIHDAARPFLPRSVLDAVLQQLSPEHGVLPALPAADTMRRQQEDGGWEEVARSGLMRMQTPQAFPFAPLKQLVDHFDSSPLAGEVRRGGVPQRHSATDGPLSLSREGRGGVASDGSYTDDAGLWLAAGLPLRYVPGAEALRKVTTEEDMRLAEGYTASTRAPRRIAVGQGVDVHTLMPAGEKGVIRLGGIDIPHGHKLHGHSDADVVLHAIADAIYGALAEGDIGAHFPPSDPSLKGADSKLFIDHARARLAAREGIVQHLDVTVVCEHPKIGPHRDAMRAAIAALLQVPPGRVSVKATTTEKLGFTGREEGIAAQALVTLSLPEEV